MRQRAGLFAILAAALTVSPFLALKIYDKLRPRSQASIVCMNGSSSGSARILVVGDSWASKGRLLPGLKDRLNGAVELGRVCSIGFSGHTTREIDEHLDVLSLDGVLGGQPSQLIILSGVNDLSRNAPVSEYIRNVKAIAARFPEAKLYIVTPPIVEVEGKPSKITRLRRAITGIFGDTDRGEMIRRLEAAYPRRALIYYDRFSRGPIIEPGRYAPDMVHLTDAEYRKLGSFIGAHVTR